jgi:YegS/Rv2252/BmrU family lipid kinase
MLIANPTAGQGAPGPKQAALEEFCRLLSSRGIDVETRTTRGPNDATNLAREATRRGFSDVIVSGGDGTVNEALQGLVAGSLRLSVWPQGTANVIAKELQLPRQPERLADIIAHGATRRIHAGIATVESTGETRYFLLMAGIGLDAAIGKNVRPFLKRRIGETAFWVSGLEYLFRWKLRRFSVEVAGQSFPATFAAIGKSPHYGGMLAVTPRASMDRPEFEVCIINSMSRLSYLKLLPFVMSGGISEGSKGVTFLRVAKARALGDGVDVQVDGEVFGSLPMSFEIAPETLEVAVPASERVPVAFST